MNLDIKVKNRFEISEILKRLLRRINKLELNNPQTPKYKVYSALISQSGTNPPTAVVLENTLGDIIWSREGVGNYMATSDNLFIENKTTLDIAPRYGFYKNSNFDSSTISIETRNAITPGVWEDGGLYNTKVEIRVYN